MKKTKIKIPKSIKLYLIKQLNKLSDLNFTGIIKRRLLTAPCNFPRTQSMDRKIPDLVQYVADHESDLGDINRYEWMYFPSSIDPEISSSSSSDTPTSTGANLPVSKLNGVKERDQAGVAVVTFSTDPYSEFKRSMITMLEAYRTCNTQPLDPDLLSELVFFYFAENEKRMHKNILKAYTDIMIEIIQTASSGCKEEVAAAAVQLEQGR